MPRLQDVASRAGVSIATASYALRGYSIVHPDTRSRVLRIARELGYQPDASAAIMASRRHSKPQPIKTLTLGFIESPHPDNPRLDAFAAHAEALGYEVESLHLRPGESPAVAGKNWWHRRVVGLFLSTPAHLPLQDNQANAFSWHRFAVIKFGRSKHRLRFDLIRLSAFDCMTQALQEVTRRGFRRLAVILAPSGSEQDDQAFLGAVLCWLELHRPKNCALEWRRILNEDRDTQPIPPQLSQWLRQFRPQAVIGFPGSLYHKLHHAGHSIPKDFAFAAVLLNPIDAPCAGCLEDSNLIAKKAVELLDKKIRLGQLGMTPNPLEIVLPPKWQDHASLPFRAYSDHPHRPRQKTKSRPPCQGERQKHQRSP